MKTLKELDEMRYAYRKKARLQKYKNINSHMAFRNKDYKNASPRERKLPVVATWNNTEPKQTVKRTLLITCTITMRDYCCVPLCIGNGGHLFPRDEHMKKLWMVSKQQNVKINNCKKKFPI